jgi:Uma2 family endonuclease
MTALKKTKPLTIEEFEAAFADRKAEYLDGEVRESQATYSHSQAQAGICEVLRSLLRKHKGGTGSRWRIITEAAVRYGTKWYFRHDVAGWRAHRLPEPPKETPLTIRPDWACEVLSTNTHADLVKKRKVLEEFQVPHYWVVYPEEKTITVFQLGERGYEFLLDVEESYIGPIPPFENLPIKVSQFFDQDSD